MKFQSFPLILLAAVLSLLAQGATVFGQITFVQSPQRNQQGQQQPQQGLSPEKKKSLSKYGPEDVFPGAREQEDPSTRSTRKSSRPSSGKTVAQKTSTVTPTPTPPLIPASTPAPVAVSPTPPAQMLAAATPATATAGAMGNHLAKSPANNPTSSGLVPAALGAASLLVLGALIYVVGILRKKLREGR